MADKHVMETIVKLAGSIDPSLAKSIQNAQVKVGGLNVKAIAMGAAFAGAAVVAVKAIADIGKGLYDLGAEFDNAYDAIRIGTGATGEALESLKDDFKDVYGSVPTTMEDASKAIADYNTRLGLTGKELSEVSKQAIAVSGMMGEDLGSTIETSSKAFQQWGISAEDMGKQMDYIFKVSQSTGMGFNELMLNMQQFGPQLQDMGYSFEQASAMMGQMEKAGVNTSEVLAAMKKSVGTLAKEGISASAGMQIYYEKIKNAGSEAEAAAIASEVFGMRAGSTLASAIRKGTLEIDAFTNALNNSDESIMGAMWDTADAAEKFGMLQQQFKLLIEPLASGVFDHVAQLMPTISKLFQQAAPIIENLTAQMLPLVDLIFEALADIASETGPMMVEIMSELLPPLVEIVKAILPAFVALLKAAAPVVTILATLIGDALTQTIQNLLPIFNNVMAILTNVLNFIANVFTGKWGEAWTNIVEIVKNLWNGLKEILLLPFKHLVNAIKHFKSAVSGGNGGNVAEIPALAAGGFTQGLSFAGEAGTEAVISFDPAYRSKNIDTWLKAGQLLGVGSSGGSSYNLGGFTFSPNLYISESMSSDDVINKLKGAEGEFCDMIDDWLARKTAGSYSSSSFAY